MSRPGLIAEIVVSLRPRPPSLGDRMTLAAIRAAMLLALALLGAMAWRVVA